MQILITLLINILFITFATKAHAVCPVCTIAVGAGVGLSRWLGIDDTISGLWIGGLLVSMTLWLVNWLSKKNMTSKYLAPISYVLITALTLVPLYFTGFFNDPYNTIFGINKILFGAGVGTIIFILSVYTDKLLRVRNQGKVYVPFQKVILPVSYLALTSLVIYLVIL